MWSLILKNPIRSAGTLIAGIGLIAMGFLLWRVNYLSNRVSAQEMAIKGYQTTITELQHNAERRDAIALRDNKDSISNELNRADIIGDIKSEQEDGKCSAVVRNTINKLLSSDATPTSD